MVHFHVFYGVAGKVANYPPLKVALCFGGILGWEKEQPRVKQRYLNSRDIFEIYS